MSSALSRFSSFQERIPLRERAASIGLTIFLHILILFLLLWLTPDILPLQKDDQALSTFDLPGPDAGKQEAAKAEKKGAEAAKSDQPQPAKKADSPAPSTKKPDTPMPTPEVAAPSFIQMSGADFAAADIGKIKGRAGEKSGSGKDAATVYGPGDGPGGSQMFNADWLRPPTSAELSGYLPSDMPRNGYGLVACRTTTRYHVENCRVLEERPLGSGLGQAVRRAAWQFLVVPPRINGKPQLGAWVRIRIDYREGVQQIR